MRLESLELDQSESAREELINLADLLRAEGLTVEIAARGEFTRTRLRESADRAFVDILNVLLDETERHAIEVVITALTTWALQHLHFRGSDNARSVVVIWVGDEDVRTLALRDPKRDVARIRDTDRWPASPWLPLVRHLDDGDVECALIYDEDVAADEGIRLFGATPQSEQALMAGTVIDGSQLPSLAEYDSLERVLADGWSVD